MPASLATLKAAITDLGLTVESVFVPVSRSRNAKDKHDPKSGHPWSPSLNWRCTIKHNGRDILTTDYSAGSAHCPAYKESIKSLGNANSVDRHDAIMDECERGKGRIFGPMSQKPILPQAHDVIWSLARDSDAIDYASYKDWADDLGYDPDSRKGEAIYRACLEIALKLRAAIGDAGLAKLREAGQGY